MESIREKKNDTILSIIMIDNYFNKNDQILNTMLLSLFWSLSSSSSSSIYIGLYGTFNKFKVWNFIWVWIYMKDDDEDHHHYFDWITDRWPLTFRKKKYSSLQFGEIQKKNQSSQPATIIGFHLENILNLKKFPKLK